VFAGSAFGWSTFAGFATFAVKRVVSGGAGGGWVRRRPRKLMTTEEARRLVDERGVLVSELDQEAEEIEVLRLLGLV
jgi:hypothetical protein